MHKISKNGWESSIKAEWLVINKKLVFKGREIILEEIL